jgi:chromosome condensin MukBEF complex kleisin-like MukF subunit
MTRRRAQRNGQSQYTQLANVQNRLKEISNRIPTVEEKYSSRNLVFSSLHYSSPSIFRFTDLTQGTTNQSIIGNVIFLKDLSLRFTATH